jgi:diguanylate cyclase (GGDEF)-like protein/PAS domain S-box-containing protein
MMKTEREAQELEWISGGPLMDRLLTSDSLGFLLRGVGIFVKDYVSGDCIPNTLWKELGYTASAMRGRRWKKYVHPEDRPLADDFEKKLLSGEADFWSGEFRIRSREGIYRTIKHKAVVLERAANALPRLYVGWDVDVTDYVEHEEKARMAYEVLEQRFLRSEEIRTAGAIVSSELDPLRSADRMLVQAKRVIPFDAAVIWTEEAGGYKAMASLGLEGIELKREFAMLESDIPDVAREPVVSTPLVGPFASRLEVPLLRRDRLIGYLEFLSFQRNSYGNEETSAAIIFAEQAGVSLSNAIRYRATEQEASTDWLTGLPTRRSFMSKTAVLVSGFSSRVNLSALMIDIDHFKQVNDGFGHAAGDVALSAMAALCRDALRVEDLCCRYGGEEIVVILPGADERIAMAAAERIRRRTEEMRLAEYPTLKLTVSIGIATGKGDEDFRDLISRADEALYLAKQAGRNRCELR